MKLALTAMIVSTALAGAAAAQEAQLAGRVSDSFGSQILVETPQGRILVTLPKDLAAPAPGARIELEGIRTGNTFAATALREGPRVPGADGATASNPATAQAGPPPDLARFGLTETATRSERNKHGLKETYLHGRTPEGIWVRLKTRDGRLTEAKSGEAALPKALIDAVLPPDLARSPELARIARITEVDVKPQGEIKVEGYATDGRRMEIEFLSDGQLREIEIKRDKRRGMSAAEAGAVLERLGYGRLGLVQVGGRHTDVVAVNPFGEWVELRINDRGQIERERLLTR
jgi:hypothetical protein